MIWFVFALFGPQSHRVASWNGKAADELSRIAVSHNYSNKFMSRYGRKLDRRA